MEEEEEENEILVEKYLADFSALSQSAIDLLNEVLSPYDNPDTKRKAQTTRPQIPSYVYKGSIKDPQDLQNRSANGLFTYKSGQNRLLVTAETQKSMLQLSGVRGATSLTLERKNAIPSKGGKKGTSGQPSVTDVLKKAVELTAEFREVEAPKPKKKVVQAVPERKTTSTVPVMTTACGEEFDPNRCMVGANGVYSWQKVKEFMEAYHLHQPTIKTEKIGGAEFTTYCDILRTHWTRYMTASLVDAFGDVVVGKSKTPVLSRKQLERMAEENSIKIIAKMTDQAIAHLLIRVMVINLLTLDAVEYGLGKAAEPIVDSLLAGNLNLSELKPKTRLAVIMLASRFNKKLLDHIGLQEDEKLDSEFQNFQQGLLNLRLSVEGLNAQQSAAVVSNLAKTVPRKTVVPMADKKSDLADIVSKIEFSEKPGGVFKNFARVLESTGILDTISASKQPLTVLIIPDKELGVVLGKLKITLERFMALPSLPKALLSMILKTEELKSGQVVALDGSKYDVKKLKGKFTITETIGRVYAYVPEEANVQSSGVKFYESDTVFCGSLIDNIKEEAEEKEVVTKNETPCERIVSSYRNKKTTKMLTMLLESGGVFGTAHSTTVDELRSNMAATIKSINATKQFSQIVDEEMATYLINLREALEKGRKINKIFNPSFNLNEVSATCKAFKDLLSGNTMPAKKVPERKPAPKPVPKKKEPSPPPEESEESEEQDLNDLFDELLKLGFEKFVTILEASNVDIPGEGKIVVFAFPDGVIDEFLSDRDMSFDDLLDNQNMVDAIKLAHSVKTSSDGPYLMGDGKTEFEAEAEPLYEDEYLLIYSTEDVRFEEETTEEKPAVKTLPPKEKGKASSCQRIMNIMQMMNMNFGTMGEFFADEAVSPLSLSEMSPKEFGEEYIDKLADQSRLDLNDVFDANLTAYILNATKAYQIGIEGEKPEDYSKLPFDCNGWGKLEIGHFQHKITGNVAKVAHSVVTKSPPKVFTSDEDFPSIVGKKGSTVVANIRVQGKAPVSETVVSPLVKAVAEEEEADL
uniref:Uncharacterized protein n=1 Tax=viral metagenome TaxID=1070528 RepID=A0A6C0CIP0_9ZZZZ